ADTGKRVAGVVVILVEVFIEHRGRGGALGAGGESHHADLVRVYAELFGVGTNQTNCLEGIGHRIGLRIVAVAAQAVPQDDGIHTVVVEERNEVCALGADIQGPVSATGGKDDRGAGIE